MKKGLFSSNISIYKLIIKKYISNEITLVFKYITTPKYIKKYQNDIEKLGFNIAKVYFSFEINNTLFLVQKLIKGDTVEEILKSNKYDISFKKEIIKKILNKIILLKENEIIIDWNLKNFILYKDKIFYVDFTPVLYRKNIMLINSQRLKPYTNMLLNTEIQFCSFLGYVCNYLIDLPKKTLKDVFEELILIAKDNDIIIKKTNKNSHLMERKISLIFEYLNTSMPRKELKRELSKYSMKHLIYDSRGDNNV